MAGRTTERFALGKKQYEKLRLGDMEWSSRPPELLDPMISCATFAGPIGVARDEHTKCRLRLKVYQANGKQLERLELVGSKARLVSFGWTAQLKILCVFENGTSIVYSAHGTEESRFHVLPRKSTDKVCRVEFNTTSAVVLTDHYLFLLVSKIDSATPQVSLLADARLKRPPKCLAILPSFNDNDNAAAAASSTSSASPVGATNAMRVIVGASKGSIVAVGTHEAKEMYRHDNGTAISHVCVAPNASLIAAMYDDGTVVVLNAASQTATLRHAMDRSHPTQMAWCGNDALIFFWNKRGVVLINVTALNPKTKRPSTQTYDFGHVPVLLCPELDGCRIYTPDTSAFIRPVPIAIQKLAAGSTEPGALLLEALEKGASKTDKVIRTLQRSKSLYQAVKQCNAAAADEFDETLQRQMVRAASMGRKGVSKHANVLDKQKTDIRVLKMLRRHPVAMPLTRTQYQQLTTRAAIDRLASLQRLDDALKLCKYAHVGPEQVLVYQATELVRTNAAVLPDEQIVELVRQTMSGCEFIALSSVAKYAEQIGRRRLATMLLDLDTIPGSAHQIDLLLSMGEFERAIVKSIRSNDTNMVYTVLFRVMKTLKSVDEFKHVLLLDAAYAQGLDLMLLFYRESKGSVSKIDAFSTDRDGQPTLETGNDAVRMAYCHHHHHHPTQQQQPPSSSWKKVKDGLKLAAKTYGKAGCTFHEQATVEQLTLLDQQTKLEKKLNRPFRGLSAGKTLEIVCSEGRHDPQLLRLADSFVQKVQMDEKLAYRIKINALAKSRQWDNLRDLATHKTPPTGFKPFAIACFKHDKLDDAEIYANRIRSDEVRFQTFWEIGLFQGAIRAAEKLGDSDKLFMVRNQCHDDPQVQRWADEAAERLAQQNALEKVESKFKSIMGEAKSKLLEKVR